MVKPLKQAESALGGVGYPVINGYYIHARCARRIAALYGLHYNEVDALCIFNTYLHRFCKDSGSARMVSHWSGARANWKRKVTKSLGLCVLAGVLGTKKTRGGATTMFMSDKGKQIIETYNERFWEVLRELEAIRAGNIKEKEDKFRIKGIKRGRRPVGLEADLVDYLP